MWAGNGLDDIGRLDTKARQLLRLRPLPGYIEGNFFVARRVLHLPEVFDQGTRIDSDRASVGTGAIDSAGLDTVVFILALQLGQQLRPLGLSRHLATKNDALPGCDGHVAARADRFAKAALDAMRGGMNVFDGWSGFEILQVNLCIMAQQNIRTQDSVWI